MGRKGVAHMSDNIGGKIVAITGASSGLGEAAARHLSEQGATVIMALGGSSASRRLPTNSTPPGARCSQSKPT